MSAIDVSTVGAILEARSARDELYQEAASTHGAALERLARAYEADADLRRDLLQEIHVALWRSFQGFDGRCSLRTWIYRVAHNVGHRTSFTKGERNCNHWLVWKNWKIFLI